MSDQPTDSAPPPGDEPATSTPPPGAAELDDAGVPAGGLNPVDSSAGGDTEVPDDTGDMRGKHFGLIIRGTPFIAITSSLGLIALIAVAANVNFAVGAAAAAVIVVIAFGIAFALASSRAADDFFNAYAAGRGLTRVGDKSSLPPVTALLRKGDRRYTDEIFSGNLPGGLAGQLALYTYEEHTRDSKGNKQTTYYHFTIAVTQLPETAPFLSELALQRRSGFRFMDSAEDVFRSRQRVEVESEVADKKFEIFTGKSDDMNRARQVFSPTFIVWLAEEAHEGIAFELVAGALVVNVKGHKKTAQDLDEFCEAAAVVARRLDEEALE